MNARTSPKRKADERFEQNNYLVRTIAKQLRNTSHVAALWVFWTYARGSGRFEMSAGLLGKVLNISDRTARRIITEMREDGVIAYADGTASNGVANTFKITFQPPKEPRTPMS